MVEKWKQWQTLFSWIPKSLQMVCSHETKRRLLLGRKAMTNIDSILKSRDMTLPTKVHLVKAMVFPVVMYGCESLTIKKAECQRIDAFELWGWRRLLRVLWTARQSNLILNDQEFRNSFLNIHWKDWCWSRNSNTLATWCKELTHWKKPWCWQRFKVGGERDDRGRDGWMASLTRWTQVWVNSRNWWWTGRPGVLQSMGLQRVGHDWATELRDDLPTATSRKLLQRPVKTLVIIYKSCIYRYTVENA